MLSFFRQTDIKSYIDPLQSRYYVTSIEKEKLVSQLQDLLKTSETIRNINMYKTIGDNIVTVKGNKGGTQFLEKIEKSQQSDLYSIIYPLFEPIESKIKDSPRVTDFRIDITRNRREILYTISVPDQLEDNLYTLTRTRFSNSITEQIRKIRLTFEPLEEGPVIKEEHVSTDTESHYKRHFGVYSTTLLRGISKHFEVLFDELYIGEFDPFDKTCVLYPTVQDNDGHISFYARQDNIPMFSDKN